MAKQEKVRKPLVLHTLTKEEEYRLFTALARLRKEGKCGRCGESYDYEQMEHED